ncbi:MAG: 23S rRNA (adenine(2503)-C(2))-methyltransferase RlmN [Lachnospiraceae bacterium]|nr:23S rRNA (adenine(2503)-C(2))-methyltransferase RlmN [Lachnospiraceae bacterium]
MELSAMTPEQLTVLMKELNEPAFRAKQIYEWIHKQCVSSFEEMSNVPKKLKEKLTAAGYTFCVPKIVEVQESKLDGTKKYLFELSDHQVVESVLMKYKHGNSVCISSQVGCKMGCRFCASTLDGWLRNLSNGEMLQQIYQIQKESGERVSNVVVMGTGEPLDNYDNLLAFIHMLSDEKGLHISQRNITVSTCGLVPKILELAEERLQITLALSLHASSQEKREELMPIAKTYEIHEVLDACRTYFDKTGRRVSFEYSLVAGVNDSEEDAARLKALIGDMNCHVNLIPVNPIKERSFKQPDRENIRRFQNKLENNGINVTIRREMGRDIDGACGQLRKKYMER